MKYLTKKAVRKFQHDVYTYYHKNQRSFPWRDTYDPYQILVSEVMLQQTQAQRVAAFFRRFVLRFPNVTKLAHAKTVDVVRFWQGLGYNRRALNLHRTACIITKEHKSRVPKDLETLDALPGVGKYTAAAILAFAFNQPSVFIETNIRVVFLHYFLKQKKKVSDSDILFLVEQTVDKKKPREWYQALMDYGAMLKREVGNENVRSKHYTKQSPFRGSRRELRGGLLKLAMKEEITQSRLVTLSRTFKVSVPEVRTIAETLVSEGFLSKIRGSYVLQ